jgi:hypothetical protein
MDLFLFAAKRSATAASVEECETTILFVSRRLPNRFEF